MKTIRNISMAIYVFNFVYKNSSHILFYIVPENRILILAIYLV